MPFGAGLRGAMLRAAFLPTSLSGCVLWLRGDLGVTSSTTFTWADQSGTGDVNKNCTSTGTARPTANASNASYNNKPTIDFNGTTNYLASGTWSSALPQPFTEFVVGHTTIHSGSSIAVDNLSGAATEAATLAQITTGNAAIYAGAFLATSSAWTSPAVVGGVFNGASSAVYFNSHTAGASGNPSTNSRTGMSIGGYNGALGNTTNSWGSGSIAEIINYSRALSASEITQVMNYLGTRYGITIA